MYLSICVFNGWHNSVIMVDMKLFLLLLTSCCWKSMSRSMASNSLFIVEPFGKVVSQPIQSVSKTGHHKNYHTFPLSFDWTEDIYCYL